MSSKMQTEPRTAHAKTSAVTVSSSALDLQQLELLPHAAKGQGMQHETISSFVSAGKMTSHARNGHTLRYCCCSRRRWGIAIAACPKSVTVAGPAACINMDWADTGHTLGHLGSNMSTG